ncbi:MAG: helix-turn-helix domain-containing protein [Nitrospinota bacterium]
MRMPKASKEAAEGGIGHRLRMVRLARGLTLRQVEGATGIGVSHLSQIENDLRNVNVAKLEALAACYGCALADFFPRAGEPEPDIYRAKHLTPTQREVLKAMEEEGMAEHLFEQARMKVRHKAVQARRRREAKGP